MLGGIFAYNEGFEVGKAIRFCYRRALMGFLVGFVTLKTYCSKIARSRASTTTTFYIRNWKEPNATLQRPIDVV
jgi:hypothetical protein